MDQGIRRSAGILMHITSLPSGYGIGDLGPGAYQFAEDIKESGFQLWQTLPLGPTGYGNSPYSPRSVFAGNEMLISPEMLYMAGLIDRYEAEPPDLPSGWVDYGEVIRWKSPLLHKAAERVLSSRLERRAFEAFKEREAYWLDGYSLFMAIHDIYGDARWHTVWDREIARKDEGALERIRKERKAEIDIYKALQYLFDRQIRALRSYASSIGVKLIGDVPIYAAADSADTWADPSLFRKDKVAGVPPDMFCPTGQLWGNPVYEWKRHEETGFDWWIRRIRRALDMADTLRLDHFKGFSEYYEIDAGAATAEHGRWRKAPGRKLFSAIREALGPISVIAEDLGWMTESERKLMALNGFPGMRLAQGGFSRNEDGTINGYNGFLPHNYPRLCVAYTGTHDNDTVRGWYGSLSEDDRHMVREYLSSPDEEIVWSMIRSIMLSSADTVIIPMQDVLELGSEARMNYPSTVSGSNWSWRMEKDAFNSYRKGRLSFLSRISGRNGMTENEYRASRRP